MRLPPVTNTLCNSYDHSSYYNRQKGQSAALLRARRPYLIKNAVVGLVMFGVAAGVCKFSPAIQVAFPMSEGD